MITSSERGETEGCNSFCKTKTVMLLMRRHDSEKAVYLYTLTYIDTRELSSRREGIVLQSNHNQLVCPREYAEKAYT